MTGCIGWIDKHHFTTSIYRFVREQLFEDAPTRIQNALAEVMVSYHVADTQIFTGDKIVVLYQRVTEFVREVPPLTRDVFLLPLDSQQCLCMVLATLLFTCQRTLCQPQLLL